MDTLRNFKLNQVMYPDVDALAGTKNTTPVNLGKYSRAEFLILRGNSTSGQTSTVKAQVAVANDSADEDWIDVPFYVTRIDRLDAVTVDETLAPATGYVLTTSNRDIHLVRVTDKMAGVASQNDKKYLRLNLVEGADEPIDAGILVALSSGAEGNFNGPTPTE